MLKLPTHSAVAQWYLPAGRQGAFLEMYVYILKSDKFNHHYVGLTDNVERRFYEHNNGWVKRTRFYRPFVLVHVELISSRIEARSMEKFFKSGYGREIVKEIESTLEIVYSAVAQW